jgi:quercetin dioxygenase-like cupin family protein
MENAMQSVNLVNAFEAVTDYWSPKIIGKVNDQYVKIAKVKGELAWHKHDNEDELFQVVKGQLVIQLEGRDAVTLQSGEFFIVPKGIMHNPVANDECWIVLIETVTTEHTGDVQTALTKTIDQQFY